MDEVSLEDRAADLMVTEAEDKRSPAEDSAEIEPWPQSVATSDLLDEIEAAIRRHVIVQDDHCVTAASLWVAHTHAIDAAYTTPILGIFSPEMRCGKTTLIDLLSQLCREACPVANITAAALFRYVEASSPTLLIDEADSFLADNEDLRGVLNAGYRRRSSFVIRTTGRDFQPTRFNVFGPKAIAMIGKPHSTLLDRSIVISMRRKLQTETVEGMRFADYSDVLRKGLRWATDNKQALEAVPPRTVDNIGDRANELWEPLLAIATHAGGAWEKRALQAAKALSQEDSAGTRRVQLLKDIQLYDGWQGGKQHTAELIRYLVGLEESPWADCRRGNAINPAQLGRMLREFEISSKSVRIGCTSKKGYSLAQFQDAFRRYLPTTPSQGVTTSQVNNNAACGENQKVTPENSVTPSNRPKANEHAVCDLVTPEIPQQADDPEDWAA